MVSTNGDAISVAITGLACRFPGDGDSLENFWQMICEGKCKLLGLTVTVVVTVREY